jgi:hypothetical protein
VTIEAARRAPAKQRAAGCRFCLVAATYVFAVRMVSGVAGRRRPVSGRRHGAADGRRPQGVLAFIMEAGPTRRTHIWPNTSLRRSACPRTQECATGSFDGPSRVTRKEPRRAPPDSRSPPRSETTGTRSSESQRFRRPSWRGALGFNARRLERFRSLKASWAETCNADACRLPPRAPPRARPGGILRCYA